MATIIGAKYNYFTGLPMEFTGGQKQKHMTHLEEKKSTTLDRKGELSFSHFMNAELKGLALR